MRTSLPRTWLAFGTTGTPDDWNPDTVFPSSLTARKPGGSMIRAKESIGNNWIASALLD